MEDIRSVLSQYQSKAKKDTDTQKTNAGPAEQATLSEIPDVFFDVVLKNFKLTRQDISLMMVLYRQVWCRPNLYKSHGIGPLHSYADICTFLGLTHDEFNSGLRNLQNYGFLETVRAGQYFVRKFFTEELDTKFGQNYDSFF